MERLREWVITLVCLVLRWLFTLIIPPHPGSTPQKILVIKPCCLGDTLMATPTLAALRAEWPDATIVVATSNWARPAIENHPAIDSFIDCAPTPQGGAGPLLETWRLAQRVRRGDFDLAVVLDRSPVVSLIPFLAGIPSRSGIDSAGRGFSLTKRVPALPLRHEADLYLDVARAAGCHPDAAALTFFPTGEDRAWAADALPKGEWVAVHPAGGVNPGSALPGKRWPSHGFRALAERLLDRGYGVVLLGGPGDYPFTQEIAALLPAHVRTHVYDFAGRSTFGQTAALLERCRLLVGNDTGVMHLAVAVATPVVAVFGPSKPLVYGPYHSSQSLVVHHEDQCGHCLFRGGLVTDCRNQFACMGAASVDEVTAAAQALMR